MDLRGFSTSHRRMRKAHEAIQFRSTIAKDERGHSEGAELHRGFRITYQQRRVGVTRPRTQFSAVVERDEPQKTKMYLSGFQSLEAARTAAKHRIDTVIYRQQRRAYRGGPTRVS